ncbi:MAG TPA: hypothetical protein VGD64_10785 [Acidisarcina sp.]
MIGPGTTGPKAVWSAKMKGTARRLRFLGFVPVLALGTFLLAALPASAQVSYTPMPLDKGFGTLDVSPPPIPPEQIITKFAAKESQFRAALENYTYERAVRQQSFDDDNKVDGEYYEVTDISFDASGRRIERVVRAPENTLQHVTMSISDFADIEQRLPFVLTTEDLPQYDVTYIGKQRVDEIDTYVFSVKPKIIEKKKRYFDGRIWVDAQELEIVVTNGKTVPDDTRKGHEDLSLPFTTYREQIDGKNWFPVYTKGDGVLHFTGGNGYLSQDVHLRLTIRYSNYHQFKSTIKILYNGQEVKDGNQPDANAKPTPPSATPPSSTSDTPQASPK